MLDSSQGTSDFKTFDIFRYHYFLVVFEIMVSFFYISHVLRQIAHMSSNRLSTSIVERERLSGILREDLADMGWYDAAISPFDMQMYALCTKYEESAQSPAWSLGALMKHLPGIYVAYGTDDKWHVGYDDNGRIIEVVKDDPIEACLSMMLEMNDVIEGRSTIVEINKVENDDGQHV